MRASRLNTLLSTLGLATLVCASENLPVVLWHGMGASSHTGGSSELKALIESKLGVRVFSISTGGTDAEQVYSGFFGNLSAQVESVCAHIADKDYLKHGFNAVGLSQGGLFLRAVVERCQHSGPPMRTLITLGAPHQGVTNIPTCTSLPQNGSSWNIWQWPCRAMQHFLDWGAYLPWVRDHVIQAQYFKDPYHHEAYLAANPFLPNINNEHKAKSVQLRKNMLSLEKLILFRFDKDFTVVPRDSAWFSVAEADIVKAMKETALYKEDFIGLKQLDEDNKILFQSFPGAHMRFNLKDFEDKVLWPYLAHGRRKQTY